jgi:GT2 family glycosyltransferase
VKSYTSISLHKIDPATGLVTDIRESRLEYKNYPVFQQLPEAAQTQEAAIEHRNYWQTVKAKLTVITVVHNQLRHTKAFINSLRRFTVNPLQIIVVNNASTDGTKEWIEEQADLATSRTRSDKVDGVAYPVSSSILICALHEAENLGWVGGINKGLDYVDSDSEYVIFANNDVIVDSSGWERRLLAHFDSTVGAVGPTSNYVAGRQNRVFDHPGVVEEETKLLIGFFMCVRKSVIDEVGLLDDLHSFEKEGSVNSGGDDLDYSIRIRSLGYRLVIARDVFVFHAGSQSLKDKLTDQEYRKLCGDADKAVAEKHGQEAADDLLEHPTRILCAVPMRHDYLHRRFAFTFGNMVKPFHWEVADIPRAHVESARTAAVKRAIELRMTHIFFLDDDHIIPADTFTRLWACDAPVAAALAFKRIQPYEPVVGTWGMMGEGQTGVILRPDWIRTGVRKVDAVGFAGVLIDLRVFKTLEDKKLDWFKWGSLGEDFSFCLSCKDAGIDIYCDTDLILDHIGENLIVNQETFYTFNPQERMTR